MRRGLWGAATVVLLLSLPLPAHADDPATAHKAAQERANKAAARFAQAQSDLARAEAGLADLQARVRRDEQQLVALKTQVQDLAVREYMRGGTVGRACRRGQAHRPDRKRSVGLSRAGTALVL